MIVLPLTEAQREAFAKQGWLVLRGVLDATTQDRLQAWVEELVTWSELGAPGLHHHEATGDGPALARSEDFVPYHAGLRAFIEQGALAQWVGDLFGEPAVLFKEKINYKLPGGAGFAPHQDATAYRFVDHHISVMVPLDPMTPESGCLDFAPGHRGGLLPELRGCITPEVAAALAWEPLEAGPGDVVLFDSYAPHRSGPNRTARARRSFYLTYNAASKGDWRARYYEDKRAEFDAAGHAFDGERARISVNDDFLGKATDARPAPRPRPIEELFARFDSPQARQMYDEAITELEHGLQCAALARRDGADDALVAAALLHDVGHLLVGDLFPIDAPLAKDWKHEDVGARYLARWFGPEVTEPVRWHVAAKRYLVAIDAAYADGLSPSSVRSLSVQGGAMGDAERADFERVEGWERAVALRRWDDEGKDPSLVVPTFDHWMPMLRALAVAPVGAVPARSSGVGVVR